MIDYLKDGNMKMCRIILVLFSLILLSKQVFSQPDLFYLDNTTVIDVNMARHKYFKDNLHRITSFGGKTEIKIPYKQEIKKNRKIIKLDDGQLCQYEFTLFPTSIDVTLFPTKVLYKK